MKVMKRCTVLITKGKARMPEIYRLACLSVLRVDPVACHLVLLGD